ncbi:tetratricopeptide repeat protein [Seonamhaeicola marinus]|uniref:Tetratricopeptide repeat protein n=1 Tax=Seonamhaeicola marinus TaxID=1912246 RepID=A0A5D0HLN3_9FLAO|nr:tetratricopeptide repeat protein [Seonamhaeicola marinus]
MIYFKTEAQSSVLHFADSLYAHGNYSKAIEHFMKYNNQSKVYDKIAKSYIAIGNYDSAILVYEKHLTNKPEDAIEKYNYGKLLYKTKRYDTASKVFKELIDLDTSNPNYQYEMGVTLVQLKDSTALKCFLNAYELDNTHQKAIFRIAKHYLKKGKNSLADEYINVGLSSYENNKELISLKAQNYYLRKQYEKAIVWFEKLISLNESTQFIHEKLSYAYARTIAYEKAIEHQVLALKFQPKNTNNLFILGRLYERNLDFENAEKCFREALEILDEPLDQEYMQLGMVLNRQKKHKEALEVYKKAVKENVSNDQAHFFLVLTKDRYYKDFDTRIKLYETFTEKFPKSVFVEMANHRISELKKEKFLKMD